MIDKNGKLFGKINIIDLLIILIIIAALVFAVLKATGSIGVETIFNGNQITQKVRITFYGSYVNDFLPDCLTIGDPVKQYETLLDLGTLTSFSSEPAYDNAFNDQTGEVVKVPKVNYCFLTFTCEAEGELSSTGFKVEDTVFVVGGNYYINIGPSRTACQIKSFELIG